MIYIIKLTKLNLLNILSLLKYIIKILIKIDRNVLTYRKKNIYVLQLKESFILYYRFYILYILYIMSYIFYNYIYIY